MCCFYNLKRKGVKMPAVDRNPYEHELFPADDPPRMTAVMRAVRKPCIGFKLLAASRNCASRQTVKEAFRFAFENIKPTDLVDVGMFQKHKNQAQENAEIVRELLLGAKGQEAEDNS